MKSYLGQFSVIFSCLIVNSVVSMGTIDYHAEDMCIAALLAEEHPNEDTLVRLCTNLDLDLNSVMPHVTTIFSCVQQLKTLGPIEFLVVNGYSQEIYDRICSMFKTIFPEQPTDAIKARIQELLEMLRKRISDASPLESPVAKKQKISPEEIATSKSDQTPHVESDDDIIVLLEGVAPIIHNTLPSDTSASAQLYLNKLQGFTMDVTCFTCTYCNRQFSITKYDKKGVAKHVINHPEHKKFVTSLCSPAGTYICTLCKKGFKAIGNLVQHVKDVEVKMKNYECLYCKLTFRRPYLLTSHIENVHAAQRMDCGHIEETAPLESMAQVTSETLPTSSCQPVSVSTSSHAQKKQIATQSVIISTLAPTAQPTDKSTHEVQVTQVTLEKILPALTIAVSSAHPVTADQPAAVNMPPRIALNAAETYLQKLQGYTKESEQYKCDYCGKIFKQERGLASHIKFNHQEHTAWVHKIHAFPENRFNCALCQSSFPTISNLIQHVKQTECGIKRNTCDLCKQVFNRPSKLQSHRAQCQLERSAQQALVTMASTQVPKNLPAPAQPADRVIQDGSAQIVSEQPGSQAVQVAVCVPVVPPQFE